MILNFLKTRTDIFAQLVRYTLVALICATLEVVIFNSLFNEIGVLGAHASAFVVATCFGFFAHNLFTYRNDRFVKKMPILFFIQICISFSLGYVILKSLLLIIYDPIFVKIIQLGITFLFNFLFSRNYSFKL